MPTEAAAGPTGDTGTASGGDDCGCCANAGTVHASITDASMTDASVIAAAMAACTREIRERLRTPEPTIMGAIYRIKLPARGRNRHFLFDTEPNR